MYKYYLQKYDEHYDAYILIQIYDTLAEAEEALANGEGDIIFKWQNKEQQEEEKQLSFEDELFV
jgi:hypothetical protein